jgi:hypothetical protein
MALPFASQLFIVESLDQPKSRWTGNMDDVFPFLISLEHLSRETIESTRRAAMFENLPHTLIALYHI